MPDHRVALKLLPEWLQTNALGRDLDAVGHGRVWQKSATGGELGYAVFPAHGVAFDNLALIVACVVGDREAETGALAIA